MEAAGADRGRVDWNEALPEEEHSVYLHWAVIVVSSCMKEEEARLRGVVRDEEAGRRVLRGVGCCMVGVHSGRPAWGRLVSGACCGVEALCERASSTT